jgi:hypothetical protein
MQAEDERANSDSAKQTSSRPSTPSQSPTTDIPEGPPAQYNQDQYNQDQGSLSLNRVGNPYQQQFGWHSQATNPWNGDWNECPPQNTLLWDAQASNQWNGRYNANPQCPPSGYFFNSPQFQQPVRGSVPPKNSWKNCRVIGRESGVVGQQQNGHLGLSKAEEDSHYYEGCTVEGGGKQWNGSANGEDGLAAAHSFWSDEKKTEPKNSIRGDIDKILSRISKNRDKGRNF